MEKYSDNSLNVNKSYKKGEIRVFRKSFLLYDSNSAIKSSLVKKER